jgi:tetratricopeptide (TPR) repeat protein
MSELMQAEQAEHADARTAALTLVEQAELALEQGQYDKAAEVAACAIESARHADDDALLGRCFLVQARIARHTGRVEQSYAALTRAKQLLGACNDVGRLLMAINLSGVLHAHSGDSVQAVELYRHGLALARVPEHAAERCGLIYNLCIDLVGSGEYQEAIHYQREGVLLSQRWSVRPGEWIAQASALAHLHLVYSQHLRQQGEYANAEEQLRAAAAALPPLDLSRWRSFSYLEALSLEDQRDVLIGLGRWAEARQIAAIEVLQRRANRTDLQRHASAHSHLADLYRHQKHWSRAISHGMRALALWRGLDSKRFLLELLDWLSQAHAQVGDFAQALLMRKELAELNTRQRREAAGLRCRLAAVERQTEQRRYRANEALAHAQRLGVIGRLIGQTHHALAEPVACVRQLLGQAQALRAQGPAGPALRAALAELSQTIDRAGALVRQLKLFSYRSMPQPTAVLLQDALRQAWQGLGPHLDAQDAQLALSGSAQLQVWCDPQRLGILLKVMLIELLQQAAAQPGELAVIQARTAAGQAGEVVLELHRAGREQTEQASARQGAASLGVALCQEISAEMHGALHALGNEQTAWHCRLQLPQALDRALPQALLPGLSMGQGARAAI